MGRARQEVLSGRWQPQSDWARGHRVLGWEMTDRTPLSRARGLGLAGSSSPRTSADAIEHLLAHTTPAAISHHKVGRRRRRNGSPREAGDDRSAPDRTGCVWIEVLVCLGNDVLLIQGSAKEPARQGGSSHQRPNPNLKGLRRLDHRLRTGLGITPAEGPILRG